MQNKDQHLFFVSLFVCAISGAFAVNYTGSFREHINLQYDLHVIVYSAAFTNSRFSGSRPFEVSIQP